MILFEGPSLIDGRPIVVLATVDGNPKTGEMLCTWIMRADIAPELAAFYGSDVSICGDCPFRTQWVQDETGTGWNPETRRCYVRLEPKELHGRAAADEALAPSELYARYRAGEFGTFDEPVGPTTPFWDVSRSGNWQWINREIPVRIGSYGDPAVVSVDLWADLVERATGFTGYTHLWRNCDKRLQKFCMASVETPAQFAEARADGWTPFFVAPDQEISWLLENYDDLLLCPATNTELTARLASRGRGPITCDGCLMCGSRMGKAIVEKAHGLALGTTDWIT